MKLRKLIEPLLNQRGQIAEAIIGQLISSSIGGLFGLAGGSPRGEKEFSSMGRRAGRQAAVDEAQQRSLRKALLARAAQAGFAIDPAAGNIADLTEALKLTSGKFRGSLVGELEGARDEFAARGGQPFTTEELGPFRTRLLPSERETLENQFTQAQNQVIGTTGQRGGQLSKSLADLSIERARAVSGAEIDAAERGKRLALSLISPFAFGESGAPAAIGSVLQDVRGQEAGTGQALMAGGAGIGALIQQLLKSRNPAPTTTINMGAPNLPTSTPLTDPNNPFINPENLRKFMGLLR